MQVLNPADIPRCSIENRNKQYALPRFAEMLFVTSPSRFRYVFGRKDSPDKSQDHNKLDVPFDPYRQNVFDA